MDLSLIVNQLKAAETVFLEIGAAAGLDAAMRANRVTPAAYVIPLSEPAEQLEFTGTVEHLEHRHFGVVIVVSCSDPTGEDAVVELATARAQVKSALVGFVPVQESGEPVIFLGGELVQFEGDGFLWWSDEFQHNNYWNN